MLQLLNAVSMDALRAGAEPAEHPVIVDAAVVPVGPVELQRVAADLRNARNPRDRLVDPERVGSGRGGGPALLAFDFAQGAGAGGPQGLGPVEGLMAIAPGHRDLLADELHAQRRNARVRCGFGGGQSDFPFFGDEGFFAPVPELPGGSDFEPEAAAPSPAPVVPPVSPPFVPLPEDPPPPDPFRA